MQHKSYPKIPAFGYDGTEDILDGKIYITPKIDGSNVAIWLFNDEYKIARRNDWISEGDKGFAPLLDFVSAEWESNMALRGYAGYECPVVIFGEFSNNQNKLKYSLKYPIIIFDVAFVTKDADGAQHFKFWEYDKTRAIAEHIVWPSVPILYQGPGWNVQGIDGIINEWLGKESVLGGPNEEGVVVKSYGRKTRFGRNYFCKIVSAEFAETSKPKVKNIRVGSGIGEWAAESFFTPARLQKAIQKIKESGEWIEEPAKKNIGKLIGVVTKDIHDEHYDEIAEKATKVAWKEVCTVVGKQVAPTLDTILLEESNGIEN